jgi:hypothetical protein
MADREEIIIDYIKGKILEIEKENAELKAKIRIEEKRLGYVSEEPGLNFKVINGGKSQSDKVAK